MRVIGASSPCGQSCTPEATAGGLAGDRLPDRPGHVDPARRPARTRSARVAASPRPSGAALSALGRPVRVLLGEQRGGAGDVRGRHRGAGHARRSRHRPGRRSSRPRPRAATMSTPGAVMSGLSAPSPSARAAAGEVGELVVSVDGADGQRGVGACRASRPARVGAAVAGGDHEQRAVLRRSASLTACSSGSTSGVSPPPRLMLMTLAPLLGRPTPCRRGSPSPAQPSVVADLAVEQLRAGRHALVLAAGGGAAAGDGRGDVGAVADHVVGVRRPSVKFARPRRPGRPGPGGWRRCRCPAPRP